MNTQPRLYEERLDEAQTDAQDTMIRDLEKKADRIHTEVKQAELNLARVKDKAEFYMKLQRVILKRSEVMEAWQAFMMLTKLTIDKNIKGITESNIEK